MTYKLICYLIISKNQYIFILFSLLKPKWDDIVIKLGIEKHHFITLIVVTDYNNFTHID